MRQSGLSHTGNILDQQMALRQQSDGRHLHNFRFPFDYTLNGSLKRLDFRGQFMGRCGSFHT